VSCICSLEVLRWRGMRAAKSRCMSCGVLFGLDELRSKMRVAE
jgi:hypothetical protein